MSVTVTFLKDRDTFTGAVTEKLIKMISDLLGEYGLSGGETAVIIAGDGYLHDLNRRFRDRDMPTDVLSFSYIDLGIGPDREHELDFAFGDIYISIDRAREQAEEAGHSLEREIMLLAIHGMLHLLGYDHEEEKDAAKMRKREQELLSLYSDSRAEGDCE
ncbi:MAG TPA: rRNA maturation RNase YbeY [Firmicutes bacterium]|nr:rRNA maturation RNase YbeY [Bacillota bacterium]